MAPGSKGSPPGFAHHRRSETMCHDQAQKHAVQRWLATGSARGKGAFVLVGQYLFIQADGGPLPPGHQRELLKTLTFPAAGSAVESW